MSAQEPYASADEVRRRNAELDAELRSLASEVPELNLHDEFSDESWTLAEQLGHLGEFPAFFARQLDAWFDRARIVVGRVAEHDPDRLDALTRATQMRLIPLQRDLDDALATLECVLARLHDDHLTAVTHNVAHGREPLTSFLERYVLGHKTAHARQLRTAIEEL